MKLTLTGTPINLATAYGRDTPTTTVKLQLVTAGTCNYGKRGTLDFVLAAQYASDDYRTNMLSDIWVSGSGTLVFEPQ